MVPRLRASLRAPPPRTPERHAARMTTRFSCFPVGAKSRDVSISKKYHAASRESHSDTRERTHPLPARLAFVPTHGNHRGSLARRRSPRDTLAAFRPPALQPDEKTETRCSRSPQLRTVPSWAAPCTTPRRAAPSASPRFPPRSRGTPCASAGRRAARFTRSSSRSSPPEVRRDLSENSRTDVFPRRVLPSRSNPAVSPFSPQADAHSLPTFRARRRVQGFLRLRGDQAGHQGVRRPRRRQAGGVLRRVRLRRRPGHRALRQSRRDRSQDEEEVRETRGEGEENAAPAAW